MTDFNDLYPFCRVLVGDRGVRKPDGTIEKHSNDYSDSDIDDALSMALLEIDDYSSQGQQTTPDIANDYDKGLIVSIAALYLVIPDGPFSMETPNMKLRISENKNQIALLLGKIETFQDGGITAEPAIWGAWDQLFNEGTLVSNRISESVGAI